MMKRLTILIAIILFSSSAMAEKFIITGETFGPPTKEDYVFSAKVYEIMNAPKTHDYERGFCDAVAVYALSNHTSPPGKITIGPRDLKLVNGRLINCMGAKP